MRFLDWLRGLWNRGGPHGADARSIGLMAREVRELARAVLMLGACDGEMADRIRRIQAEMEELEALASRPRFRRLPLARRQELRDSLTQSRQRLLRTMQAVPAASPRVQ